MPSRTRPTDILTRLLRLALASVLLAGLSGCYYLQATAGHLELMGKREPIEAVLEAPATEALLRQRLMLVQEARDFSIKELRLPDNQSYRSYAALERDYVLWSLFAAPADALTPKTWCYPFVGCLGYRGYFKRERVQREAEKLQKQGYDVAISGVVAYSTLGKFDDPMLDTMMRWDDAQLVGTLFHELAHQVIYIKDDTMFNESFATAVEELGLERWLAARDDQEMARRYATRKRLGRDVLALVEAARTDLARIYTESRDDWREQKSRRLAQLSADVAQQMAASGLRGAHWLSGELNNAHLIPIALYDGRVLAFRALFERCARDFECLYAETRRLGKLPAEARDLELDALAGG